MTATRVPPGAQLTSTWPIESGSLRTPHATSDTIEDREIPPVSATAGRAQGGQAVAHGIPRDGVEPVRGTRTSIRMGPVPSSAEIQRWSSRTNAIRPVTPIDDAGVADGAVDPTGATGAGLTGPPNDGRWVRSGPASRPAAITATAATAATPTIGRSEAGNPESAKPPRSSPGGG